MIKDRDLKSIQEIRELVYKAKLAQGEFVKFSDDFIDDILENIANKAYEKGKYLAELAVEETGFGKVEDKYIKNEIASIKVYNHIKNIKTLGIIREDKEKKIIEIGTPVGVVAGLIPSTNPTSTVIYKTLIALKGGNSIVFSPHPSALKSILKTVEIINDAILEMGGPEGLVSSMSIPTIEGTSELMKHNDISLILATGGFGMVKAAYSSGTPALGVGPGNVPVFIERTSNIGEAVYKIISSKTFDNSTVCASEQSVVTENCIKDKVKQEFTKRGGYFLNTEEAQQVMAVMETATGGMNPKIVGKSALYIANLAEVKVPEDTILLIYEEKGVGKEFPFSKEKLCCLLGFYSVDDWQEACELSFKLLRNGGLGHTLSIHSNDENVIREFALKKPVSRLLVNTPSVQGAVGLSTNLAPAFTLGCGAIGNNATSDNVGPQHLINIRRMAYGINDLSKEKESPIDVDLIAKLVINELMKKL